VTPIEKATADILKRFSDKMLADMKKAGDQPAWVKAGLALIKREQEGRYPKSPPLISVQPMSPPHGGVAFYRPRYGEQEPAAVDRLAAIADPDSETAQKIRDYDARNQVWENAQ